MHPSRSILYSVRLTGLVLVLGSLSSCTTLDATGQSPLPAAFRLTSPGLADNGMLSPKNAGNSKANPNCTGENVSPPLAWFDAPPQTRSFAIMVHDQSGRNGLGVSHWIAYGIPANAAGLSEGEANAASSKYVGGANIYGAPQYAGPCPVRNGAPQHYVFTLVATDLEPGALKPGLDQQALLAALTGHNLGAASLVLRYAQ